jgi:hypothetical protein
MSLVYIHGAPVYIHQYILNCHITIWETITRFVLLIRCVLAVSWRSCCPAYPGCEQNAGSAGESSPWPGHTLLSSGPPHPGTQIHSTANRSDIHSERNSDRQQKRQTD